jgi:hypothetical protein
MFEALGVIMKGFIYIWMAIIATIPGAFMNGLAICIVATLITYFMRRKAN